MDPPDTLGIPRTPIVADLINSVDCRRESRNVIEPAIGTKQRGYSRLGWFENDMTRNEMAEEVSPIYINKYHIKQIVN